MYQFAAMFSQLLSSRVVARLPASLNAAAITRSCVPSLTLLSPLHSRTRRTLVTTARLAIPDNPAISNPRPTSKATAGGKKSPARKATASTKTKPAKKRGASRKVVPKKKVKKPVKKPAPKPKIRFDKASIPPTLPPNPYLLFCKEHLLGLGRPTTTEALRERIIDAARLWKGYSIEQKQPYVDEYHATMAEYRNKRDQYYKNVDPKFLKALNKHRVARGKQRVRGPHLNPEKRKPVSSFFQYLAMFRETPEAREILSEGNKDNKNPIIRLSILAGERWRAMSEEEREVYKKESKEMMEQWKAQHSNTT